MAPAAPQPADLPLRSRDMLVLALLAAVVLVAKLPTVATPLYWDEMAWVSQSRWLAEHHLIQALPGWRPADLFWGHPPALHLTLAALAKVFGYSITLAHLIPIAFAVIGVWFAYLLGRMLYDTRTGIAAALLLLLSPIYFAQSGMFLSDAPVAALGLMSIYFALRRRFWPYLLTATYMALMKETSIALLAALLVYLVLESRPRTRAEWLSITRYAFPLAALGLFAAWQRLMTGHFFFIYDPSHFDIALFQLTPEVVAAQLGDVTRMLFVEQGRWVLTAAIVINLVLHASARRRPELRLFALIVLFSGYSFAALFYLPRYLLPVLPYVYLLGAWSLMELVRPPAWRTPVLLLVVAFMVVSLATQPFTRNAEFNPRYLDVVRTHRAMTEHIAAEFPDARVLTAWPHTSQLIDPHLGYVTRGLRDVWSVRQRHPGDDADLILVSPTPSTEGMAELRAFVVSNGWRLVKRVENAPVVSELYARPAFMAGESTPPLDGRAAGRD